jgi:putative CocE/NonD family hydrolase
MIGRARVLLWVASTAADTDFVVRLVDVQPDGYAANVAEGIVRTRYRHGGEEAWLTSGESVELTIEMCPTAYTFLEGHRIRLDVTSSSFPQYTRNLNSVVRPEFGSTEDIVIAEQTVLHDTSHPSRLSLPVVENLNFIGPFPRMGPTLGPNILRRTGFIA